MLCCVDCPLSRDIWVQVTSLEKVGYRGCQCSLGIDYFRLQFFFPLHCFTWDEKCHIESIPWRSTPLILSSPGNIVAIQTWTTERFHFYVFPSFSWSPMYMIVFIKLGSWGMHTTPSAPFLWLCVNLACSSTMIAFGLWKRIWRNLLITWNEFCVASVGGGSWCFCGVFE